MLKLQYGDLFIPESNKMEFGDFIYARKQAIVEDGSKFREKENLHHDS